MLVPLADMCNHEIPEMAQWGYSEEKQGFYIRASRAIKKGEEIYLNYGEELSNLMWFY